MNRSVGLALVLASAFAVSCSKEEPAKPAPTATAAATGAAVAPKEATSAAAPPVEIDPSLLPAFGALPASFESKDNPITPDKVALGRMLYFDKRLSKNQDVACNSCHLLDKYGVDGTPTSTGHKKQKGGRNAPTVYNAGAHLAQFWDGRAATLEDQAKGPILNPIEMAMSDEREVVKRLEGMAGYATQFQEAFPGVARPITYDNLARAIVWATETMKKDGLEQVRTERVMIPRWVRGAESLAMVSPPQYTMPMLGLGGSVATPPEGLEAEVLVVRNFDELNQRTAEAKGKIADK